MDVSVVICTRNRAASLTRTIESIGRAGVPSQLDWELLVVNNGSTDDTSEVIRRSAASLPIREETEPTPGLSCARNAGIMAARGQYIIWTDDDVLVDREWLPAYAEAFARWPEAAVFGGKILPLFERPAPEWFTSNLNVLFGTIAYCDLGDEPLALSADLLPFGANYAVRAIEQRAFLYDPELGVAPGRNRTCEELAVMTAILASGASGIWVPGARVLHVIPSNRVTTRHIGRHFRAHGETQAYLQGLNCNANRLGAPPWLWRRMLTRAARYYLSRVADSPQIWIQNLKRYSEDRGMVEYLWSQADEFRRSGSKQH